MNKHAIILPMILTSAISLHVLSFYLEEPEEIVENPTPISTPADPNASQVAVAPSGTTDVNVNVTNTTVNPDATTTTTTTTVTTPADPVTPASPVTATGTAPDQTIQVAAALIPTKSYDEMVREAKQIGGRVDPFLSMKPPEVEAIPELPEPPATTVTTTVAPPTKFNKPGFQHRQIPAPPSTWVPEGNNPPAKIGSLPAKPNNGKTYIPIPPASNGKTVINKNTTTTTTPNGTTIKNNETIVITPEVRLDDGLELTGIITGNKRLALINVDGEGKVFGVGDVIRKDSGLKLVSIDFENDTVTISNSRNKRARLDIK